MAALSESVVEDAALDWLRELGYDVISGPDMPPGPHALRESYADVVFDSSLRGALEQLNPNLPSQALDDAFRKLTRPGRFDAGCPQPGFSPYAGRWSDCGVSQR